ncbi:MAG TPA: APC family permease [Candidatus Polarisedimenticolia bacterium]|nr:APC family permease [Candidatus Polarisedimenticolia bacterium]
MKGEGGRTLVQGLGTLDVAFITFNCLVGSAIFIAAGIVPRAAPSAWLILPLWIAGGALCLAGVATYSELGTMFPEAGGQYQYLKEAYGPLWGFLYGWTAFLVIQSGVIAYIAVAGADGLGRFWPALSSARTLIEVPIGSATWRIHGSQVGGALLIALITAINWFGLRAGATLQNAIAAVKIAAVFAFVGFGLLATPTASSPWSEPLPPGPLWSMLAVGMIGVLWCFDGFYQAGFCASEIRDPARSLPRGMFLGTAGTILVYALLNVVYLRALPPRALGEAPRVGEAAAAALLGPGAGRLMSAAVLVSILGCLATVILTAARIYLPMAQDGVFFRTLARIHPRYRTPAACLLAQAGWSIVLAFTGSYEQLGTYVLFATFLFHTANGCAVFVLRRARPDWPRPYRAWGYPLTPALFILVSLTFVGSTLSERPVESLWGLGIVALGLPAYAWWRRLDASPRAAAKTAESG